LVDDFAEIYKSKEGLRKHHLGGASNCKLRMKLKMASSPKKK
jgi:hypothetical protein